MPNSFKRIALVALPSFEPLDVAGPEQVFEAATRLHRYLDRPIPYEVDLIGPQAWVENSHGRRWEVTPFTDYPHLPDTVIVAGGLNYPRQEQKPEDLEALVKLTQEARRIASVCTGAFILAQLGLLDGKRATTHWMYLEDLRENYPQIDVEQDAIYVRSDNIYSSAGVSTGMDLSLALVSEDLGPKLARQVAQLLVLFLQRPGGQSQFSVALQQRSPEEAAIQQVVAAITDAPGADHRIPVLARQAGMSPRNFSRVFTKELGCSPGAFVGQVRLEAARQLLEQTQLELEAVAERSGFGSAESMRKAFQKKLGVAPVHYRQRFFHQNALGAEI